MGLGLHRGCGGDYGAAGSVGHEGVPEEALRATAQAKGQGGVSIHTRSLFPETLGPHCPGDAAGQGAGGALMVLPRAHVEVSSGLGSSSVFRITGLARSARKSTQAGLRLLTGVGTKVQTELVARDDGHSQGH